MAGIHQISYDPYLCGCLITKGWGLFKSAFCS